MNKRIGYALLVVGLLYLSVAGQYLNNDITFEQASFLAMINMLIISAIMMFVPFCIRLSKKDLMEHKEGRNICIWNSIIIFILSIVLSMATDGKYYIGGLSVLAYYFVNMWVFVKSKNIEADTEKANTEIETDKEDEELKNITNNIEKEKNNEIKEKEDTNDKETENKKYCTKCGKTIENEWVFCNYCGNKLK